MTGSARAWVGVASRDHVRTGVAGGFAQLGHGKVAPVARLGAGDWIVYYSPRTALEGGEPVQAFTAIGRVLDRPPYPAAMGEGLTAMRRDVAFLHATDAPIRPLLPLLSFTRDRSNWGYALRRGSFAIPMDDLVLIAAAMGVAPEVAA
jgi:EVE domain